MTFWRVEFFLDRLKEATVLEHEDENKVETSNKSDDDHQEITDELLRAAAIYTASKKAFKPTIDDIHKLAKEKGILFDDAREELQKEAKSNQEQMVMFARKLRNPRTTKNIREQLGVKGSGRPKGSKNKNTNISRDEFYKKLSQLVISKNQMGEDLTQKEAAETLGFGGERQLRNRLREYGDERKWKDIVSSLTT